MSGVDVWSSTRYQDPTRCPPDTKAGFDTRTRPNARSPTSSQDETQPSGWRGPDRVADWDAI